MRSHGGMLPAGWLAGLRISCSLHIHETWKEMMGGGTRTPSGQELDCELLMWQCFPAFKMSKSPSAKIDCSVICIAEWLSAHIKLLQVSPFNQTQTPEDFLYGHHSYSSTHPSKLSYSVIKSMLFFPFNMFLRSFNLFRRIPRILPKNECENI